MDENKKTEPHEHSKYMPRSESEASPSGSAEVQNERKLEFVAKALELSEQDSAQEDQKTSYPIAPARSSDGNCNYHSKSRTTHTCSKCKTTICNVCAFINPSNSSLAFCPKCVSKPLTVYPTERKNGLIIAYLMALVSTLASGFLFSGLLYSEGMSEAAAGLIVIALILLPSIIGSSFSYGIMDKDRGNGIGVWLALSWNALILSSITALMFIGNLIS